MFVALGFVLTSSPRWICHLQAGHSLSAWLEAACKAGKTRLWPLNHQRWIPIMLCSASSAPTAAPPVIRLSSSCSLQTALPSSSTAVAPPTGGGSTSGEAVPELRWPSLTWETPLSDHRCSTSEKLSGWLGQRQVGLQSIQTKAPNRRTAPSWQLLLSSSRTKPRSPLRDSSPPTLHHLTPAFISFPSFFLGMTISPHPAALSYRENRAVKGRNHFPSRRWQLPSHRPFASLSGDSFQRQEWAHQAISHRMKSYVAKWSQISIKFWNDPTKIPRMSNHHNHNVYSWMFLLLDMCAHNLSEHYSCYLIPVWWNKREIWVICPERTFVLR